MSSFDSEPLYRSLPRLPDLGHLRDEAKSLKKICASGDAGAIAFIDFHRGKPSSAVKLADAQFALARSYGFKSWPRLKAYVEAQCRSPEERAALLLQSLFGDNHLLLQELYDRRDSLPASDFFVAAALGNVAVVESMLAADSAWASRVGGPMQTQAITYAAHARFSLTDHTYPARQQRIVTLLLSHGADPSSFAREQSAGRTRWWAPVSPLWLLSPAWKQPRSRSCCSMQEPPPTMANRCITHRSCRTPAAWNFCSPPVCRTRVGSFASGGRWIPKIPAALAVYLRNGTNPNHLDWALFRNRSLRIIQLLIEHGADPNRLTEDYWLLERIRGLTPVQVAERGGMVDAVSYLLANGAADNRTPGDRLIGACARADQEAARAIVEAHPDIVGTLTGLDHSNIATFARESRLGSVQLMLDVGFDIEARADDLDATALHYAATKGDVPMLRLLLAHGANLEVKHKYGGTALGTAIYCAASFRNEERRYAESVRLLLEAGSKATDEQLEFAVENDLDDVADVLKAHGVSL
ncbi:MAG: ankyrin repeat domain-containing protein [Gammaproteobacteria bacterium]